MHSDRDENEGASKDTRAACRRVEGKSGCTGEGSTLTRLRVWAFTVKGGLRPTPRSDGLWLYCAGCHVFAFAIKCEFY